MEEKVRRVSGWMMRRGLARVVVEEGQWRRTLAATSLALRNARRLALHLPGLSRYSAAAHSCELLMATASRVRRGEALVHSVV